LVPGASSPAGVAQGQPALAAPAANSAQPAPVPQSAAAQKDPAAERLNPDDYEPATEPGAALGFNHIKRATDSGLTLYQDAAAAPGAGLPQLRLDLHVFASKPQERFVMINMHRLREGDSLPEGVRVESITPDGAVLSHNGSKYLLPRD
jgi:hypothetical protein